MALRFTIPRADQSAMPASTIAAARVGELQPPTAKEASTQRVKSKTTAREKVNDAERALTAAYNPAATDKAVWATSAAMLIGFRLASAHGAHDANTGYTSARATSVQEKLRNVKSMNVPANVHAAASLKGRCVRKSLRIVAAGRKETPVRR